MFNPFKNQSFSGSIVRNDIASRGIPRTVEFFLAICGLILLFPVLLPCALLVWISSPGGMFFCQRRVGRNGKIFTLYKFRTMVITNGGSLVTAQNDRRITAVGRILRKSKLDELPEFYNVLRGDMSFVGPRPEVPELVDFSNPLWNQILKARPGITDPITLSLRNEEAFLAAVEDKETFYRTVIQPYKLNGYMEYLATKCVRTDLKLVVRTAKVVLLPHTAQPPNLEEYELSFIK